MIEFLRSAKHPGHTTRDSSLGIDEETALADDAFAFFDAGEHWVIIRACWTELNLSAFEFTIAFGHVNDLAHTGIENGRTGYGEDIGPCWPREFDLHEHAGSQSHAGVRNLDAS